MTDEGRDWVEDTQNRLLFNDEEEINQLKCPKCSSLLIRVNEIKNNQRIDCKWMCISPICRKEMEFDTYYGYTQEDINNQVKECSEFGKT